MTDPQRKPDPGIERARADAGLTGDKVAVSDPAAAPVQSDAESAGTPTSAAEAGKATAALAQVFSGHGAGGHGRRLWVGLAIVLLLVVAGVAAGWVSLTG